jgi:chromosomal replication initiation ATPase DnaA
MIAASRSLAEGAAPGVERPVQLSAETVWSEVSARLKQTLSDGPYAQWFSGASGALQEDAFVLFVRDDFTREWIDGHYRGLVEAAVALVGAAVAAGVSTPRIPSKKSFA